MSARPSASLANQSVSTAGARSTPHVHSLGGDFSAALIAQVAVGVLTKSRSSERFAALQQSKDELHKQMRADRLSKGLNRRRSAEQLQETACTLFAYAPHHYPF